jgi:hypothetical protein
MTDNIKDQIEALTREIALEEQKVHDNMPITQITGIGERIFSKKLELQRLLALQVQEAPSNFREQLDALDSQIKVLEDQITGATTRLTADFAPNKLYSRLTALKLQKQELLTKRTP